MDREASGIQIAELLHEFYQVAQCALHYRSQNQARVVNDENQS